MVKIGCILQRMNGKLIMVYNKKHSGARMPLITTHWNTNANAVNSTGLECGLRELAGIGGEPCPN